MARKDRQFKALVTTHTETIAFTSCVDSWKYVEPKAEVGTLCEEHGVSAFLFFLHHLLCCLWILSTRGVASE